MPTISTNTVRGRSYKKIFTRKFIIRKFLYTKISRSTVVHTKSGEKLKKKGGLSYTRMREIVLEKLSELGLDRKLFGLHSLRSGGASAAASAGVPDRHFKHHGRWRSENAKDGYIKDSLESRLSVSQRIGV